MFHPYEAITLIRKADMQTVAESNTYPEYSSFWNGFEELLRTQMMPKVPMLVERNIFAESQNQNAL